MHIRTFAAALAFLACAALQAQDCESVVAEGSPRASAEPERVRIEPAGVMVRIPGGEFCMGDIAGNGEADERPVHMESVPLFWLASHEVTLGQFRHFADSTGYVSDAEREDSAQAGCLAVDPDKWSFKYRPALNWKNPGFEQDETHAVVCVSYEDALAFIGWLNEQTGRSFRLPTEAEWEYVARAGSRRVYPWGNDALESCRHGNVADRNVWAGIAKSPFGRIDCDDGYAFIAPVGSYAPNALGIYDVSGNAWEWNASCWSRDYSQPDDSPTCGFRAFRGSSWMNSEKSLRAANRSKNGPTDRLNTVGFRLALDQ